MLNALRAKLRVFLIDDHPVVREGFARALADAPDIEVVGQAGTSVEAQQLAPATKPDVVLVDLQMPDRDGMELIQSLSAQMPAAKLVVLSAYEDDYRVAEALRAGAHGYLVKTAPIDEIIDAVRRSAVGEAALSARVAGAVVRAMRKPSAVGTFGMGLLTPREHQVVRLLAAGTSTREAAGRLTISPKTIETHRVRIYEKLGCRSAVELTRIAVRAGVIEA